MKIKHLKENLTPASTPSVKTIPPKFGRSDEMLESGCGGTSSGDVGSVAAPMGKMQKRGKGSMFAGIKTSEKFANSRKAGIKEGKNSELDSLYDQYDELDYDGNSESDKEKMRHIQQKIKDLKAKDKKVNESYYNHDDNRTGFSKPTRQDDERNPEFDDKMRKLTGMIFYNVNDPDLAQQLGLKQTRTGKWFLRTGNRNAQQAADRAFGQGKVWYPQNESMEEGQQWPDSSNSLAKRSAIATNLKGAPSNAGRASGMTVATRVDPSITSTKVQRKDDRPIPSFLQKEDVESSPVTDLKTWQVVIFNNYYAGKYSDYRGRYYYVLARNADEAKQVVLDNSDGILKDILSMKSHNGKRILPPSKAVPITSGRIGKIEDGTVAGRMSTAGYKKMFGPQGLMMVKLSGGAVQDIQEPAVDEGMFDTIKQIPKKADAWLNSPIKGMQGQHAGHAVNGAMAGMAHGHAVGHAMADVGVAEGSRTPQDWEVKSAVWGLDKRGVHQEPQNIKSHFVRADRSSRAEEKAKREYEPGRGTWEIHPRGNKEQGVAEGSDDNEPFDYEEWKASTVKPRKPRGHKEAEFIRQQQAEINRERTKAQQAKEQGVAEGGYPEVDHMPGPVTKRTQTGCKRCHGKGYVYKTPDGQVHPMNRSDAKTYKCGKCNGIGFVKVAEQGVAEEQVNEKSKSQAQFRTMAAVAHNPKFAKKVGISQKVGKEFHSADRKQNYKDLPKEVDEAGGNVPSGMTWQGGKLQKRPELVAAAKGNRNYQAYLKRKAAKEKAEQPVDEASFDYTTKDLGNDYAGFPSQHSLKHKMLAKIKPEKQQLYKDKMNNTRDWDSLFALFKVAKARGDIIEPGDSQPTMGLNASLEQHADDKMKELGHKFKGVSEGDNPEYDDEAGSAESNLHTIARAAQGLIDSIGENDNLPEWCQEKIAKVEGMLVAVWDYLESQEAQGIDPQVDEDWQKTNQHDKTDGMSPKAVKAYRRENPGSKLKTAVTTKPSKLKAGSKDANRRKSFCARMSGNKGPMKDEKGRPTPKAKALSRWNCESVEQTVQMLESVQHDLAEMKQRLDPKCWKGYKKQGTKMKGGTRVNNCVPIDEAEVSEDKLASDLYKDFQIFKKGDDKGIGSKAKDKEISGKAKDKEIVTKEGFGDTIKKKAKQFSRYMTEPNSPHNDQVRSRAKNIDQIRQKEAKKSVFEKDPEAMREFERSGGYKAGIDVMGWQVGWAAAKHAQGDTMKEAFQKLYYGGGASFPFSQKAFKLAWVAYNKHYGPQGNLEEMDGDGAGRDGSNRKSHSTYGSRDKHHASNGPDVHLGSDSAMTSKDIQDRALDTLTKMLSKPENMNVLKRLKNK